MKVLSCRCIVKGFARGRALISYTPINFLTMVNIKNGEIKDSGGNLCGKSLKDKILVFPHSTGSSVGAYVFFALKRNSASPSAIICSSRMDITTASGCAIANIPAVVIQDEKILSTIKNRQLITVDGGRERIMLE